MTARTSSPRRAKSAERMLGAMRNPERFMASEMLPSSTDARSQEIQRRGHGAFDLPPRPVGRGRGPLRVRVHDPHHQQRQRERAAREPALDHHRCGQPGTGSARHGRSGRAARAQARRHVRVFQRVVDPDRGRDDARQLPARGRGRHALRGEHPGVHAERAAHPALIAPHRSSSLGSSGFGFLGMVHHTIATAIASATKISRNTQPMPPLSAIPRGCVAVLLLAIAGCASPPPPREVALAPEPLVCPPVEKPACPAPATPATPAPPPAPAVEYRGKLQLASWLDLPDWRREPLRPALEAFLRGCPVLEKQDAWKGVCSGAQTLIGAPEGEIAAFFELNFDPHQVVNVDDSATGMVTGYYEPLLRGSR